MRSAARSGSTAGYYGGWVDAVISRACDVILSFPIIILYVILISTIGPSILNIVLAVVIASSPGIARIVRGLTLEQRHLDYVAAAQLRRENALFIMFVELLPNCRGPLITDFCLRVGYTIITIGILGFLGLGLPPPDPDWGTMVKEGTVMISVHPYMSLFPAIAIVVAGARLQPAGRRRARTVDEGVSAMAEPLLSIENLRVEYHGAAGAVTAIPDLSFQVRPGESYGIVGESGCGKSTLLMAIMRHLGQTGRVAGGRILFDGRDLASASPARTRRSPRPRHRHGLPGPERRPEPDHEDRRAAHGSADASRRALGAERGARAGAAHARPTCICPIPTASWSAIRTRCPAARSSASSSPWRCSPTRSCCCSTSRPPGST